MTFPKWRVERCGAATHGYLPGWIAMNPAATRGAVFTTHSEAFAFASRQARLDEQDSKRALMKLTARGARAAGLPGKHTRPYRRVSDTEITAAEAMRTNGRSWREIAEALGVNHSTIMKAVERSRQ